MVTRVVTFPIKATYGVGKAGVKTGYTAGRLSVRSTYKAGRWVGVSRLLALALGVVIGLLAAPTSSWPTPPAVSTTRPT